MAEPFVQRYSHYITETESYIYRIMGNVQHNGYVSFYRHKLVKAEYINASSTINLKNP